LKEIIKKPAQEKTMPQPKTFEKLKELTQKLTPQERKKFKLIKNKKLTKEETEQLIKKLRKTAAGKKR
ncbi:hypothetical protein HY484_00605, partial [Candidatus Woesearchaeota archaeon]|nr:hypothetical protein [Candidatus Woesearchaeota archaeon]